MILDGILTRNTLNAGFRENEWHEENESSNFNPSQHELLPEADCFGCGMMCMMPQSDESHLECVDVEHARKIEDVRRSFLYCHHIVPRS